MEAENISLNDSCQREIVEKTGEVLPNFWISILSEALVVESIYLGDLSRFVVAAD